MTRFSIPDPRSLWRLANACTGLWRDLFNRACFLTQAGRLNKSPHTVYAFANRSNPRSSALLPPENVNRRKMGFGVPVGQWFRGPLRDMLRDAVLSPRSLGRELFREPEVRRLVDEHLERRADHSFQLWNLLMLELWHREFLEL
jgi:hypothetical protein